ncbi:MAG: ABC transporter substrate-binding protein, partial [Desulfobacteraceae bacterium]|nr:ABC transporter substrate-binding protein [Desulfobacteraceae bacterium]
FPGPVFAKEYCIAMITWRGETIAEKGFIDELDKSTHEITLIKYNADQDNARLQKIITRICSNPVDIIYVFGTTATKAVLLRIKDIPVVFNIVSRPVGSGIIASWDCSKNNATGASNKVSAIHQLKTLKKVINYKNLGIIYNPKEQNSIIQRNNVKRLENTLHFSLKEYKVSREQDIFKTLPQMRDKVDAVFLPADSMVKFLGKRIMEIVNKYKIPSLSSVGSMVPEDGVLLGFVPKYYELGRIAAKKAILILNGTKPSDIPSSVLDHYDISVNMKTAKNINIQIPMSVLVMANQIVRW